MHLWRWFRRHVLDPGMRTFTQFGVDDGYLLAAGVAYYVGLSLFPMIWVLMSVIGAVLRFTHLGQVPADQPAVRDRYARLLLRATQARVLLSDTLEAIAAGREDATLRILQVKAVAAEAAGSVADGVMRLCGGSAFRPSSSIQRIALAGSRPRHCRLPAP